MKSVGIADGVSSRCSSNVKNRAGGRIAEPEAKQQSRRQNNRAGSRRIEPDAMCTQNLNGCNSCYKHG